MSSLKWDNTPDFFFLRRMGFMPATMETWNALYRRLEIVIPPAAVPLPKPTNAALDRYEAETGSKLPRSYRQFVKVFGPGSLCEWFRICVPGYADRKMIDLREYDRGTHEGDDLFSEIYGQPELVQRLVFFSHTFGGDIIGWDPESRSKEEALDYMIYGLPRTERHIVKVADSFPKFIEGVLRGTALKNICYATKEKMRQCFQTCVVRSGKKR